MIFMPKIENKSKEVGVVKIHWKSIFCDSFFSILFYRKVDNLSMKELTPPSTRNTLKKLSKKIA